MTVMDTATITSAAVAVPETDRSQVRAAAVQAHVQVAPTLAHQACRFGRAGRESKEIVATRLSVLAAAM